MKSEKPKAICLSCGYSIEVVGRECPHCHAPLTINEINKPNLNRHNEYEIKDIVMLVVSFFIPLIGICYYKFSGELKNTFSKYILYSSLIGIIFYLFVITIMLISKII